MNQVVGKKYKVYEQMSAIKTVYSVTIIGSLFNEHFTLNYLVNNLYLL